MTRFLIIILILSLTACGRRTNNNSTKDTAQTDSVPVVKAYDKDTLIKFNSFSAIIAKGWTEVKDTSSMIIGDATSRYDFQNKRGEIVHIDCGLGASDISAIPYTIPASYRENYKLRNDDTSFVIFSDDPAIKQKLKNKIETFRYENISGFKTKLFYPVKFGFGYSGVFIDSIGNIGGNIASFCWYIKNPMPADTVDLFLAIRTLKLGKFD